MSENSETCLLSFLGAQDEVLICPIRCPKSKDIQLIVKYETKKLQILTFEKLQPEKVWCFFLKRMSIY